MSAIVDIQFAVDILDMVFSCADGDMKFLGDFSIGCSGHDKLHYFYFALAQRIYDRYLLFLNWISDWECGQAAGLYSLGRFRVRRPCKADGPSVSPSSRKTRM